MTIIVVGISEEGNSLHHHCCFRPLTKHSPGPASLPANTSTAYQSVRRGAYNIKLFQLSRSKKMKNVPPFFLFACDYIVKKDEHKWSGINDRCSISIQMIHLHECSYQSECGCVVSAIFPTLAPASDWSVWFWRLLYWLGC